MYIGEGLAIKPHKHLRFFIDDDVMMKKPTLYGSFFASYYNCTIRSFDCYLS